MSVKIARQSRLRFYELVKVDGREFWDIPEEFTIEPQEDDIVYQWDEVDLPSNVAFNFYGDQTLFWVIAKRNQMFEWPGELKTGDKIVIPSVRYVTEVLFANK